MVWNYRSPLMLRLIGSLCCNDDNDGDMNSSIIIYLYCLRIALRGQDRSCGTASSPTAKLFVVAAFNVISVRRPGKENGPKKTAKMDSSISTRQSHFISLALILPQPKSDNINKDFEGATTRASVDEIVFCLRIDERHAISEHDRGC